MNRKHSAPNNPYEGTAEARLDRTLAEARAIRAEIVEAIERHEREIIAAITAERLREAGTGY